MTVRKQVNESWHRFANWLLTGNGAAALAAMRSMMERLKLTVNEEKTHLCRLPEETFDFLGYTFGRLWSYRTGGPYYGMRPSAKAIKRLRRDIHEKTNRRWLWTDLEERVATINRTLIGWANYFSVGTASRTHSAVDAYVFQRFRQWWCAKHKVRNRRDSRFSKLYANRQIGLVRLRERRRRVA